jgi:hypothetical protein
MFIDEDVLPDRERKNPPGQFEIQVIFSSKLLCRSNYSQLRDKTELGSMGII